MGAILGALCAPLLGTSRCHFGVTSPLFEHHGCHFELKPPVFWAPPLLMSPGVPSGSSETGGDPKATDVPSEGGPAPRRARKKKSVSWPEEGRLREYFYFELDETERGEQKNPKFTPNLPRDCPQRPFASFRGSLGPFWDHFRVIL